MIVFARVAAGAGIAGGALALLFAGFLTLLALELLSAERR